MKSVPTESVMQLSMKAQQVSHLGVLVVVRVVDVYGVGQPLTVV